MPVIHPTACVESSAQIADDVVIGPFCVVGPHASLGSGCHLVSHVSIVGHTTIGAGTRVYPFASLGTPPQSVHYKGGPTRLVVGAGCQIREGVTMNIGTEADRAVTEVGDRCFLMVGSHVGHDCVVGNNVTFANNAVLGGHVVVGDGVFLGGNCAVHQHVRIGEGAMIGGLSGVRTDLIPFGYAVGQLADLVGLNVVGLRRRGCSRADLHRLRRVYRELFTGAGTFSERVAAVTREYADDAMAGKIIAFVQDCGNRSLMHPAKTAGAGDAES